MATRTLLRQAQRLRASRGQFVGRAAKLLPGFFAAQAGRAIGRFERMSDSTGGHAKALADQVLPDEEDRLLWELLFGVLAGSMVSAGSIAASMVDTQPFDSRLDPRLQTLLLQSGQRIRGINDTTRRAVQETILTGYERGYSDYQIANGVERDGYRGLRAVVTETYQNRAVAIARTEVAIASNRAFADRMDRAGVTFVEILDGPGCGWATHEDPRLANGLIVPVAEFNAQPLAHPHCRRIGLPFTAALGAAVPVRVGVPAIVGAL